MPRKPNPNKVEGKSTRLNLVYGPEMKPTIDKLKRLGNHPTQHALIKKALKVYEIILDEQEKGSDILFRNEEETLVLVLI